MLKLNVNRTFKAPVPITLLTEDGEEVSAEFTATFKVMSRKQAQQDADKPLLDVVLVGLDDIDLMDANDQKLTGKQLIEAAKNDPALSASLVQSYWDNVVKKPQRKT